MLFVTKHDSARVRIGVAGSLVVVLYRASPDMNDMHAIDRVEDEVLTSFEKLSMLTIIGTTGAMSMPADVRQYSVDLSHKYGPRVLGSAIVVTAKGLSAAMARAALSALILVMRGDLPLKNFSSVAEAMSWFRELPGQTGMPTDVEVEQYFV